MAVPETRHYHQTARQFFYVLAGVLSFEIDSKDLDLMPRQESRSLRLYPIESLIVRGKDAEFIVIIEPA